LARRAGGHGGQGAGEATVGEDRRINGSDTPRSSVQSPLRSFVCYPEEFLQNCSFRDYRTMPAGHGKPHRDGYQPGLGASCRSRSIRRNSGAVRVEHVRRVRVTRRPGRRVVRRRARQHCRQIGRVREPSAGSTRMPARRSGGSAVDPRVRAVAQPVTGTSMNGRGRFSVRTPHHSCGGDRGGHDVAHAQQGGQSECEPGHGVHRQPEQSRPVDGPAQARRPAGRGQNAM